VLPNQPNRMRSARHGIERDSGFEQFASQEVSIGTRLPAPPTGLPWTTGFSPQRPMISLNSSKIVGDCAVKTAALAELRRENSNAGAAAQFVDFIEDIHDIETDFDGCLCRDLDAA